MTAPVAPRRSALARRGVLAAAFAAALAGWSPDARPQGIGLPGGDDAKPVEIEAENGIEWNRKAKIYVARGNARARQGEVSVFADVMTAHYRDSQDGRADIWRIDAEGSVRLVSPDQAAYGDKAVYRVDQGVLVLTGRPWLDAGAIRVSARDRLEYLQKRNLLVARGDAVATRGEDRLRADVLSARLAAGPDGKTQVQRIEALGNVQISSPDGIAQAGEGVYEPDTRTAVLSGGVKITRGGNQLNGERAEIDLETGVSKLFGRSREPVRGLVVPRAARRPAAGDVGGAPRP